MNIAGSRRERLLRQAVCAITEDVAAESLKGFPDVSPSSKARLDAAVQQATCLGEERGDFLIQAHEIADEAVNNSLVAVQGLLGAYGVAPVFSDLEDWPIYSVDVPLPAISPSADASRTNPSSYEIGLLHRVAHGFLAAALTGQRVSVGFSGFRVPNSAASSRHRLRILLAGQVVDMLVARGQPPKGGCECSTLAFEFILRELAITGLSGVGTLFEQLEAVGQTQVVHGYFMAAWTKTGPLVVEALESGLLQAAAAELNADGRITVDPDRAREALGDELGNQRFSDAIVDVGR
jgi:hypothetical protein